MNNLQIFNNNEFGNLRVVQKDNQTWFVAKDVCECLGLSNSRKALSRLDNDAKGVTTSDTLDGKHKMIPVIER